MFSLRPESPRSKRYFAALLLVIATISSKLIAIISSIAITVNHHIQAVQPDSSSKSIATTTIHPRMLR